MAKKKFRAPVGEFFKAATGPDEPAIDHKITRRENKEANSMLAEVVKPVPRPTNSQSLV